MRFGALSLFLAIAATAVGCGAILGFEEARDLETTAVAGGPTLDGGAPVATDTVDPAPGAPGLVCVPPPPEGFQGPVAIFEGSGTPAPSPPDCLTRYTLTYDGVDRPNAPAPACTCQCIAPTTGLLSCGDPVANFYKDMNCTMPCGTPDQIVPTMNATANAGCSAWNETGCAVSAPWVKLSSAKVKGPACTAEMSGTTPAPVSWSANVRLCGPTPDVTASCPGAKVPTAVTTLPYAPGNYCIVSRSVAACPSTYPAKRVYFDPDKVEDTRACDTCSCGALEGTCGGYVKTCDTAASCGGGERDTAGLPQSCFATGSNNTAFGYSASIVPSNVRCRPIGGGAKGNFKATTPLTICCRL